MSLLDQVLAAATGRHPRRQQPGATEVPSATVPGGRPRILVAEDGQHIAELLSLWLQKAGYHPLLATDGMAAWREFELRRPDLVTLDLNLPRISGFRLIRIFKREAPRVPVLVITGYDFQEAAEVAQFGADGFLTKPFSSEQLIAQVERALGCSGVNGTTTHTMRDRVDRSAAKQGSNRSFPTHIPQYH